MATYNVITKYIFSLNKNIGIRFVARKLFGLIVVFVVIVLFRIFVVEFYNVDSGSMEGTLFTGDVIVVNKLPYGPVLPQKTRDIPFLDGLAYATGLYSFIEKTHWAYRRLPGTGEIKQDDIIVFAHPQTGSYTVKRCVGLPGDTIQINHNIRYVNHIPLIDPAVSKFSFCVKLKSDNLPVDTLRKMGISSEDFLWRDGIYYHLSIALSTIELLRRCPLVDDVIIDDFPKGANGPALFPYSPQYAFTRENYGPVIIPKKNRAIRLDTSNIMFYKNIIVQDDHNELTVTNGKVLINNKLATWYTFKMNYYFMMGDNRYHSIDSRYWGFVPESSIVGKVWFVLMAFNNNIKGWDKITWKRTFNSVN
jgi:signal peptidase I